MVRQQSRIMVVDDDLEVLAVLGDLLESLGYRPERVQEGEEAIRRIRGESFDLVLLDLGLEDVSGVAVLQHIKHVAPDTEVIIVTGQGSLDTAIAAVRLDAFDYLQKPFGLVMLADTVERALERRVERLAEHDKLEALLEPETRKNGKAGEPGRPTSLDRGLLENLVWDCPDALLAAHSDGRIIVVNQEAVRLFGIGASELVSQNVSDVLDMGEAPGFVWSVLKERRRLVGFESFVVNQCTDRRIAVEVNWSVVEDESGEPVSMVGALRDVTETRPLVREMNLANQKLQALAVSDPVTGLYNHRHFQAALRVEIERGRRHGRPVSLLMIDIDLFKTVNDAYGHSFGDEVLRRLAAAMQSQLRSSDVPCRYAGDEFAVVLPETRAEDAQTLAQRVLKSVRELRIPAPKGEDGLALSVSIGVATYPDDASSAPEVNGLADQALYAAKNSGRGRAIAASSLEPV